MKKQSFITILLTIFMSMAGAKAFGHDIEVANNDGVTIYYIWIKNNTELAVSYGGSYESPYSNGYTGNVVIPESVDYEGNTYPVTSIGGLAFYECSGLTSVTIPNSVTSIGNYAFNYCSGLTSITIPQSVTIGSFAFSGCSGLASVKVTVTDYSAFCNNKIVNLVINKIEKPIQFQLIDSEGKEITEYIVPNDVTSIGISAFHNCSGLTSVTIPNSVTSIGDEAFYNCSGLTSVTIPNSVTTIGNHAFRDCSGLTSVIIGSGVLSIGLYAFNNTNLKKTIWLTNTPPSGYDYVIGTVNYVSNDQFYINNKVVYKFLSSNFVVDGIRYVPVSPSDRTCDAIDCTYDASIENINIGETVTNKGVTLTVMKVNPYTCYQNKHIKDVKLSLGGDVGDYAFYGCTGLNTATVSNKGGIGTYAFNSCSALTTTTISNQGSIGEYAFQSCSALTTATINNQGGVSNYSFSGCSLLETAELGQNVTSIGGYAFNGCSKLKSIVIPDAVTSLGSHAFSGCAAMTSAKTGNGIETINEYTFLDCSSLTEMIIGSKVKTINQRAFYGCSSLPAIIIPQAVTTIGDYVFSRCKSLTKVTIADSETTLTLGSNGSNPIFASCPLDYVYIGRDISYKTSSSDGYSPFYRNTKLREVKITDKETDISENEFYGCTNLQTVTIGDGMTTIGKWAFSGCQNLKFFAFGTQVKTIGQEAFSDCTSVVEIISKAQTPPVCDSQALDDINKWECKLYVPEGCLATYETAEQWKDFFYKEEGTGSGGETPDDTTINGTCGETVNYSYDKSTHTLTITGTGEMTNYDYGSNEAPWFSYANEIQSIEIESGITYIGNFTFYKCSGITTLTIPASVTSIGSSAFEDCTGLTSLTISNGLETIGGSAFENCTGLTSLSIPSTVNIISINAFKNCTSITDVYCFAEDVPETDENAFDGTPTESAILHVPASSISAYKKVQPWSDFKETMAIGYEGIINGKCGESANYSYDQSTHKLTISGTGEMTNYDYSSNEAPWSSYANEIQSVEIESGITSIGNFTFYKCSGITSLNIPATVTSIGSSAFEDCTGLTSLTLNEGLETVSGSAFEGCTGLKTLKIPSTVKTISINAFKNCTGITDVYCSAEDVPETDENAFDGTPTESAILHVPASSISAYIDAWPWSDFKAKIAIGATGDVDSNGIIDHDDLDDIVEHIMGRTPAGFKVEEADLNGDKKVNAVDVTIIINMIK